MSGKGGKYVSVYERFGWAVVEKERERETHIHIRQRLGRNLATTIFTL